jgi:hypothetical protein
MAITLAFPLKRHGASRPVFAGLLRSITGQLALFRSKSLTLALAHGSEPGASAFRLMMRTHLLRYDKAVVETFEQKSQKL